MKLTLTKDIGAERKRARALLDEKFAALHAEVLGPKAALYAVKYAAAIAYLGGTVSPLIASRAEAEAIVAKNTDMQAALAAIEADRQRLQAEIDSAATAHELDLILSR